MITKKPEAAEGSIEAAGDFFDTSKSVCYTTP